MTENIGKLIFDCSYGSAWFRGIIVGETEKTFSVQEPGRRSKNRRYKSPSDILMPAGTDPEAAIKRYSVAYASFRDEVKAAEEALSAIRAQQKQTAIDALRTAP